MIVAILLLTIGLAAANGANDVSKGVATLAGAGITRYRVAIAWGTITTLLGALLSIILGRAMGKLFSSGIVSARPTEIFTLAVLCGAAAWVTLASVARLPVSTTHAIVGALLGAGLMFAPDTVHGKVLLTKVVAPLLLTIAVAYAISMVLNLGLRAAVRYRVRAGGDGPGAAVQLQVASAGNAEPATKTQRFMTIAHWLSSGAASCARGLNDTPKIAALGAFALAPAGFSGTSVAVITAAAMALGSLWGIRVAQVLGERVVTMRHGEGFLANLTTAVLVGTGATLGLPMSTTQVSSGAIMGIAGNNVRRINWPTVRGFVIAWTVTPAFAAAVAALVYLAASLFS